MRRIFIFGSNGMLGWITAHYLNLNGKQVVTLSRKDFNVLSDTTESFEKKYKIKKGDVLINAIAVTSHDSKNQTKSIFNKVNTEFPKTLDELSGRTGCTFVHITTDGAYKSDIGGYWESSPKDGFGIYAKTKIAGENLKHAVVLRISIIGIEQNRSRHLISWILKQEGKSINGFTNHTWNGMTTLQFAKIVLYFLGKGFPKPGLYHIFSKRIVTKYELVEMIVNIFDLDIKLNLHQTEAPVLRHLATEKPLCKKLQIPDILDQLVELKKYCKTQKIIWKST